MTTYNLELLIGGTILLSAVYIPEVYFKSLSNRLITLFFGVTAVFVGIQELAQTIIPTSSGFPTLVPANRWFFTTLIIGSYLFITFLILRKLIQISRTPRAS